jgi:hypothetical protein
VKWLRQHRQAAAKTASTSFGCEIACGTEEIAKTEVEKQESLETDPEAEWIYLKPEGTRQWVAG